MPVTRTAQIATDDVDQARCAVAEAFCGHTLVPLDRGGVHCRFRSQRAGAIGIHALDYGLPVSIEPGDLGDFYLVQMPVRGTARVRLGSQEIVSSSGLASLVSPDATLSMTWGTQNPQEILYIERTALESQLSRMLGHPVDQPVRFPLGMDLTTPAGLSWRRAVDTLRSDLADNPVITDDRVVGVWEQHLITHLLLTQPHAYSQQLHDGPPPTAGAVRRAVDHIHRNLTEGVSVVELAEVAGVSVRTLQEGFRHQLDTTPLRYRRNCQLDAIHRELDASSPTEVQVTDVAQAYGLSHLGRFAAAYRERFGQTPSDTLRADTSLSRQRRRTTHVPRPFRPSS